ncbi:MAG TPA: outer membrane beta-barrel protein [Gammaproteobacteria bacterium]
MNNTLKTAIAAALVTGGIALAAPASAGSYANVQLAVSDVGYSSSYNGYGYSGFDNGITLVGTFGMTLPAVHKYFGWEAEIAKSVVNPEYSYSGTYYSYNFDYDYFNLGGYAVFTIPVHPKIDVRGRGGLVYHNYEVTYQYCDTWGTTWCSSTSFSDSEINPSVGGGAVFKVSPNLNLMAELTAFNVSDESLHLSAGAQFKF